MNGKQLMISKYLLMKIIVQKYIILLLLYEDWSSHIIINRYLKPCWKEKEFVNMTEMSYELGICICREQTVIVILIFPIIS